MERYCNMCRRLANAERVNLLRTVMTILEPGGLPVQHLAELAGMKVSATCQYLAQLEGECGFVESVRQGRYVLYRTATQFDSDRTARLVAALSYLFRREENGRFVWRKSARSTPVFVAVMPALENEARIGVLAAIQAGGPLTKNDLVHRLGMSEINVRRHLKVLEKCGLVTRNDSQVEYRALDDQLAQLFVREALRLFSEQNKSLAPSQFTNVDGGVRGSVVVDRIPFAECEEELSNYEVVCGDSIGPDVMVDSPGSVGTGYDNPDFSGEADSYPLHSRRSRHIAMKPCCG